MHRVQMLAVVACLIVGCGPASEQGAAPDEKVSQQAESVSMSVDIGSSGAIEQVLWQLEALLTEAGGMAPPLPDTTIDIQFDSGKLGGNAGCNRYFGAYTLEDGGGLTLPSETGSTQMACEPPIMAQEQLYLSLLGRVAGWQIAVDELILSDKADQALLEFDRARLPTLEGTTWQAIGINNGKGGVVSSAGTHLATASFVAGTLSGSGGCNQFNATYESDGDRISIGPASSTRKACTEPEGIMDQERQYFEALTRATTVTLAPGKLELRDDNGSLQVGFKIQ